MARLAFFFLLLAIDWASPALAADVSCTKRFAAVHSLFVSEDAEPWIQGTPLGERLRKEYERVRSHKNRKYNQWLDAGTTSRPPHVPDGYKVTGKIGGGYEGAVYEIQDGEGRLFALKTFDKADPEKIFIDAVSALNQLARTGVPTVQIHAVNIPEKSLVMERVHGFDVRHLLDRDSLNLSDEMRADIRKRYETFLRAYPGLSDQSPGRANIVLDLRTGKFLVVDPR